MVNKTRKIHLPKHAATFHSLHKWHKNLFQELGWMVLIKAKGYNDKVRVYKHSIKTYLDTARHVLSEYESQNRKHDINVLIMNVEALKQFVDSNL